MSEGINESVVGQATLDWLNGLGYEVLSGLGLVLPKGTGPSAK
jgi:hypothetical protein